ncbi:MAG: hypothetical protein JO257_07270 [Deltaproteobacteria bacterium]|nr:hypothetical protein [Deltaproteobacteria bacterium]
MRLPLFVVFDVTSLPDGAIAIGGTDEYIAETFDLSEDRLRGRTAVLVLHGGAQIETKVTGIAVHTALSGRRNVSRFLRSATGLPEGRDR